MSIYKEVLASQRWKDLKWERIMYAKFCCENCGRRYVGSKVKGAMKVFQLHHRHYMTVGNEQLPDVMILCRTCHRLTHDLITEGDS